MGPFEEKTKLSVIIMDDFKLILGLNFLRDTNTAVLLHRDALLVMSDKPCTIPAQVGKLRGKNLSAMQFEKGCQRNEPSYLCALRFEEME